MSTNENNIGEQIRTAVQDAINNQDYSTLKETVQQSLGIAAESIAQGLGRMQESTRAQTQRNLQQTAARQAAAAQRQQRAQEQAIVQSRYTKVGAAKAGGIAMGIAGGALALSCFGSSATTGIGAAVAGGATSILFTIGMAMLAVFGIAGIALCAFGVSKATLAGRFSLYKRILGVREYCSVAQLAQMTGRSEDAVTKDLRKMIAKGMFTQGHLSADETILMVTDKSYEQYKKALDAQRKREQEQLLAKKAEQPTETPQLTPEQRSLLEMGDAYLAKIRAINRIIPDADVTKKIDQIELVVNKIFEYAETHPEVIGDLQRLMDYYLPTTIKLLDAYADLDSQPVQGENIMASKREIEDTLDTLSVAFEKLLDSIFRDMTWDVSTDISVLHTVLAQEGLIDGAFDTKPNDDKAS